MTESGRSRSPPSPPTVSARKSSPPAARCWTSSPSSRTASSPSIWAEFDWGCEYYAEHRPDDGRGRPGDPEELRRHLLRRRGLGERPRPHQPVGSAAEHHPELRPVGQRPPGQVPPRRASPRCARPTTPTSTGSSSGRTAKASTPASAAATCPARGPGNEVALQTALFTEKGCERIIRFAFDLARTRRVKKVSSVTKSNAQQYGMVLWDETFTRVAKDYPDVATESVLVDAMSAKFVLKPEDLSVVVASNLNADILSDLGSALAGSLGLAASANCNPERRFPTHVRAGPRLRTRHRRPGHSNPIGTIASPAP